MFRVKCLAISLLAFSLLACAPSQRGEKEINIGTISGPETEIVEVAKKVAKDKYGLKLNIITFEDYIVPNTALADGELDANMFQHQPYLDVVLEKKKYALSPIGKMFIYPMGFYSKKYKHINELPNGATIGIPNDPSNAARALRLLAKAELIEIPPHLNDLDLNPKTILANPHQFNIKEIPAPQLARVLNDLDAAVINTTYALPAGLSLKEALYTEDKNSPYANIVVVRTSEKDEPKYAQMMEALHSPEVLAKSKELFKDQAIPAW